MDIDILDVLSLIHRGKDSYIGFVRKPNATKFDKKGNPYNFENLGSISINSL